MKTNRLTCFALATALGVGLMGLGFATESAMGNSTNGSSPAMNALIEQIEKENDPYRLQRNADGNVISITLGYNLANDKNLALVEQLCSLQELNLKGIKLTDDLTKEGISRLNYLTNLVRLRICCSGQLRSGLVQEACGLKRLRSLSLVAAYPPRDEYSSITNLPNLAELQVTYCTNFGDMELSLLTNCVNLKNLVLFSDGLSANGTNVLKHMKGLTNALIKVQEPQR